MHLKKRWIYIIFVLAFIPTPAYSQLMSLSKLRSGKHNFRLGYVRDFGSHGMWLGTDRGLGDSTKVSTSATLFFPPGGSIGIYESSQIMHITPLGSTGLDVFFFGDLSLFIERYDRYYDLRVGVKILRYSIKDVWLGGGGGLSKRLGRFTPFASLFYQRLLFTTKDEPVVHWYTLSTGVEIEITPHIDLTGRVEVWYEREFGVDLPPAVYIGLNLH